MPPQQPDDQATLAALTLILLSDQNEEAIRQHVLSVLEPLGLAPIAITGALALLHPHAPSPNLTANPNTAQGHVARIEFPYSAAYLLNSARRLAGSGSLATERTYLGQHLQAQTIRREAAQRVDAAARMFGPVLGWRSVMDERTTIACKRAHGHVFRFDRPPAIGYPGSLHAGACFPAGTVVSGGALVASSARWYSGEVVELRTRAGRHMTVTPNHPILTPGGWVAAGLLDEGSDVTGCVDPERMAMEVHPDDHQVPALIEDVAHALGGASSVVARRVPTAPEDFHGDGLGSEIHVVRTHGFLRDRLNVELVEEPRAQQGLGGRHTDAALLASEGALAPSLPRLDAALVDRRDTSAESGVRLDGSVSRFGVAPVLGGRSLRHHQAVRRGGIAYLDTGHLETLDDEHATDPEAAGERQHRFTLGVPGRDLFRHDAGFRDQGPDAPRFGERTLLSDRSPNTALLDDGADGLGIEADDPRRLIQTLASHVHLDRIVELRRRGFTGHVYNLTTRTGWYISQGLIVHNCRCLPGPPWEGASTVDEALAGVAREG